MAQSERASRRTYQIRLEAMMDAIREDMASGALREGDFLPSEKTFAKQYRLSNNTVRKGLELLVEEGLLEKVPRIGNRVIRRPASADIKVTFGCHVSLMREAAMQTLVAEFHKRYPHIRIELVRMSPELNHFSRVQELMGGGMDMCTINYNGFDSFREHDGFELLEPFEPNAGVYPFLSRIFTYEGKQRLQPLLFTPLVLCYNKGHFRENGIAEPDSGWTWDDLFRAAEQLGVDGERVGFYFHYPSSNRWPAMFLQNGLRFERDESGRLTADRERLRQSLALCRRIYANNRFPPFLSEEDADAEELFFAGKASMILTTYLGLNRYERKSGLEYDVAPLPYASVPATLLLSVGVAINAKSGVKAAAKQFADFLVSEEAQLHIRRRTLSIPSLKYAAEWVGEGKEEWIYRPYRFHMYREIIPTFRTFSDLNLSLGRLEALYKEARLYWAGLESESDTVERLLAFVAGLDSAETEREAQEGEVV